MSRQSGELPPGWALTELGALSERLGGGTPSRSVKRYFRGNIPWVTVADLPPIGAAPPTILASREAITDEAIAASSAKPIPKDSVVFATRVSVGKVAIAGCTLATNQDFRSLLPGSAHEPAYIAWFLSHIAQFNLPANQGTTIKGITTSKFDGIQVPLPPLAEQRRIVAKIEALHERSRRAREVLAEVGPLLEQFRQSVLAAAFRGDLTADWRAAHPNVEPASELLQRVRAERRRRWEQAELAKYEAKGQKPYKNWQDKYEEPEPVDDFDLPELPEGWVWASVDEISSHIVDCPHSTPKWTEAGKLCVRTTEFRPGQLDIANARFVSQETFDERTYRLKPQPGDVLYSREGGILGVSCQVPADTELCLGQRMMLMRTDGHFLSRLLMHWLNSPRTLDRVKRLTLGSASPHLNVGEVKRFPVPVASIEEQSKLLEIIESCLAIPEACGQMAMDYEQQLDHLDQSILAKAFRGELVPQDPSDEAASVLLERIRAQRKQKMEAPKQTSKIHGMNKMGKNSSPLTPQQLTLTDVLTTKGELMAPTGY